MGKYLLQTQKLWVDYKTHIPACNSPCDYRWVWHFWLWSFQGRDTKLERFLAKNQLYSNEITNFENWSNGELSKIGHHFSNKRL